MGLPDEVLEDEQGKEGDEMDVGRAVGGREEIPQYEKRTHPYKPRGGS